MPNWTNNRLEFNSQEEAEKVFNGMQFVKTYYDTDVYGNIIGEYNANIFSFETIMPTPKTKEECPEDCLVDENSHIELDLERPWFDWYKWNNKYWGVKWDASDSYLNDEILCFYTPWCAPYYNLFQAIADKFNVEFTLAINNEDGGWEEYDYIFKPNEPMIKEFSEWQAKKNDNEDNAIF